MSFVMLMRRLLAFPKEGGWLLREPILGWGVGRFSPTSWPPGRGWRANQSLRADDLLSHAVKIE